MLSHIQIRNFALIDDLSLQLEEGFSVLTGETGAGKSIIIDAITAVLGERLSADMIRTGADRATVEASFDVSTNSATQAKAAELGIEIEDGQILISRELFQGGKTQGRINGRLSTISMLKDLTSGMIDIHGQHEHQSLLSVEQHLEIIDQWCGESVTELRGKVKNLHTELRSLNSELEQLKSDERERARLLDLYEFQRTEISSANLSPGEDEELLLVRSRLANAERLRELACGVYSAINGSEGIEGGATDMLSAALVQLKAMAEVDESLATTVQDLETALYAAEQAQSAVLTYRDRVESDPSELESVEDRLDLIRTLKRKYGDTIEEIILYGKNVAAKTNDLTHSEERAAELLEKIENVQDKMLGSARRLSDERKAGASKFAEAVKEQLNDLAMENTQFDVSFEEVSPSEKGIDSAEFVISPNPGEPLKPLAKIASGGEISRVMLALKTVMAGADAVPTLIFDEIDTGIGGRTAQVLGQKLQAVAQTAQVLCVTHLPQIASCADIHYSVEKTVENGRTVVRINRMEGDGRVEETARMLSGSEQSVAAIEHAKDMLAAAGHYTP